MYVQLCWWMSENYNYIMINAESAWQITLKIKCQKERKLTFWDWNCRWKQNVKGELTICNWNWYNDEEEFYLVNSNIQLQYCWFQCNIPKVSYDTYLLYISVSVYQQDCDYSVTTYTCTAICVWTLFCKTVTVPFHKWQYIALQ